VFGDESSRNGNWLSSSVLGEDFWNSDSEVVGGDGNVEELLEKGGNIKSVSGIESSNEVGVENVVSQVHLEGLAGWVSDRPDSWGDGESLWLLDVEEGSVHGKLEDGIGGDLWSVAVLSKVKGDSSKVWDGNLGAILGKVGIECGLNDMLDCTLNLGNDRWEERALDEWNENISNLGNKTSVELDINIVWVNVDVSLDDGKLWSKVGSWSSWLGA